MRRIVRRWCTKAFHLRNGTCYNYRVTASWFPENFVLSADPELRQLQLQWLRDEIWMKRLVFGVVLAHPPLGFVAVALSQSQLSVVAAVATSLVTLPLAYFFGRGPPRRRPQPFTRARAGPETTAIATHGAEPL